MKTPTSPVPAVSDNSRPDQDFEPLTRALPGWLLSASVRQREAFKKAAPLPLPTANAAQQAAFKQLNGAHWQAQSRVDNALKDLKDAKAFGKPLLADALKQQFNLELDVEATFIRLYIPLTIPWFPVRSGAARAWTVSLLDAALHNFEHKETLADAYEPASTYITRPDASGRFDTLPAIKHQLPVAAFAQLCRDLDLGARYMRYLRSGLGMDSPVASAALQTKVDASQKAALRAALQLARLRQDIQDDYAQVIEGFIEGRTGLRLGTDAVLCHEFSMMGTPLTGILLFAPDLENTRSVRRLVAYVPDDPEHPLKEYRSALAFKQELTRQLRATDYQAFFSRFVAHEHLGAFFADLSRRLEKITWHPSEQGKGLAPWRAEPTDDPKLQFSAIPIMGDPWVFLYQSRLNKILNDARTLAVATATVDRNARWARWDAFVNVASSILNTLLMVVAPFIPGLGELMLGYMAYQLLDDVFEGIVDWAEGLDREAFAHLMGLLESAVQLGLFSAGTQIGVPELRKLLSPQTLAFIDRFKPVTLANGARRYWKPDLGPYQQKLQLPPHLGIDERGLHDVRRESILALEGKLYAVEKSPEDNQYRIQHPTRADAYQPQLHHNNHGTWRTELDQPLQWAKPTLLGRLGHRAQGLSDADRELALALSGTPEDSLRKVHQHSEPLPPLLDDALARLRIERDLDTLIERLNSDDPAVYGRIDPQDLLQLLTANGSWPHTRGLRFLDDQGRVAWVFGDQSKPLVQIHEAQLTNGDLLKAVLKALTPEEIRAQFGERASDPQLSLETRARNLRKRLAEIARKHRGALFDSRYAFLQYSLHPQAQRLIESAPGLPASVAEKLLGQATAQELTALREQRTPPRLAQLAQATLTEVRLNRAYEGLHLDSHINLDSDQLTLSALRLLPGWSTDVNLQARHRTIDGSRGRSIGPDSAPIRRNLVRLDSGRYVPYDERGPLSGETDLYTAILHALPDAQRDQLNIGIHQGAELRERLRQHPPPRHELRVLLGAEPEPAVETLQLLGNDAGYAQQPPAAGGPVSLQQRARTLYPGLRDTQLHALIEQLQTRPGGAATQLAQLAQEYTQLNRDLLAWQTDIPTHHPTSAQALSTWERRQEEQSRLVIAHQLKQAWRRETRIDDYYEDPARDGHVLNLNANFLGELPRLDAQFDHISMLLLDGSENLQGVLPFLSRFPRLRQLGVMNTPLDALPAHITSLPQLNSLQLSNCRITLTPESLARLSAMHQLRSLDLNGNPLGLVPSVEALPELVALDLSNTGIERLPAGLLSRTELQAAILNDNRISTLPEAIFDLSAESSRRFDLSRNPLSRATLEKVKTYYQAHRTYLEANALPADMRDAQQLFPTFRDEQINQFIFDLPGDIEAGRVALAQLAADYQTLTEELQTWARAPALSDVERGRRTVLKELLERSWRRETPQQTRWFNSLEISSALAGELPPMSIRFEHIGGIRIEGNGRPLHLDHFLSSFNKLNVVDISDAPLGDIPAPLFNLQRLEFLGLPRCSITLSASSVRGLEGMSNLAFLDLNHNPLGLVPDFNRLPRLNRVHLRNTGLREVPTGLLSSEQHAAVDLSNNAIEYLPASLSDLPDAIARGIDLSGNPLSRQALEQIKTYCQRTGEFFSARVSTAQRTRVQQLYPTFIDSEADRFSFKLPGTMNDIDAEMGELEEEYRQLDTDLDEWILDVPTHHPILDIPLDEQTRAEQQLVRRNFKTLLKQAWRYESPEDEESLDDDLTHAVTLETPILGALPQLSARFEHVTSFELISNGTTTEVDGTLRGFTELQTLTLNKCSLQTLPTSIFNMPHLSSLDLAECRLSLTPESARSLETLNGIEFLDLSNNPLRHAPDVSHLYQLTSLHLRDAQLRAVPEGVFRLESLHTLDLSNNQIETLPNAILETATTLDSDSDLRGNPLAAHSLELLRHYYQRTGFAFYVQAATRDAQGNPLAPPLPPQEE